MSSNIKSIAPKERRGTKRKHTKKKCSICSKYMINRNYGDLCIYCFLKTYPDIIYVGEDSRKVFVVTSITKKFPQYRCILNKKLPDGGFADIFLYKRSRCIIINVGTNEHVQYAGDIDKMINMGTNINKKYVYFLRFNLDEYSITGADDTVNYTSCWTTDKYVRNIEECEKRIDGLFKSIQHCMRDKPDEKINIIHLYYDIIDNDIQPRDMIDIRALMNDEKNIRKLNGYKKTEHVVKGNRIKYIINKGGKIKISRLESTVQNIIDMGNGNFRYEMIGNNSSFTFNIISSNVILFKKE